MSRARAPAVTFAPERRMHINGLDAAQRALLRCALEQREAELSAATPALAAPGELAVQEVETSPADKATVRLLNDLAHDAADQRAARLHSLRHAVAKFDAGAYGECERCGHPIGFSRLQARPEARLCIACQTRAEQRQPGPIG